MIHDKRLGEVLTDSQGIFTQIMTAHEVPWAEDDTITGALLDFEYMFNQSGDKIISPAVLKNLNDDNELETTDFNKLCDVAWMMYGKRWARLWEILTAEFNPLNNYDMSETKYFDHGHVETNSGTDTTNRTGTDTVTHTGDTESEVSAFNSSTYQDSSKDTQNTTDLDTRNMSDALVHGHILTNSGRDTETTTRSGNIGVTTSQQMAQSSLDLWKWNYFYDIFRDIDSIFTITTY